MLGLLKSFGTSWQSITQLVKDRPPGAGRGVFPDPLAAGCAYRRLGMYAAEIDQTHQAILETALAEYLNRVIT